MPKDTVERAIKKATGGAGGEDYAEVRYEGYGPGGVAVIVEALTDNRNRTASDMRAALQPSHGGALGETNAVAFLFSRLGVVRYPAIVASEDEMLEAAIEAGAENVESGAEGHEVTDLGGELLRRARRAGGAVRPARPRRSSTGGRPRPWRSTRTAPPRC